MTYCYSKYLYFYHWDLSDRTRREYSFLTVVLSIQYTGGFRLYSYFFLLSVETQSDDLFLKKCCMASKVSYQIRQEKLSFFKISNQNWKSVAISKFVTRGTTKLRNGSRKTGCFFSENLGYWRRNFVFRWCATNSTCPVVEFGKVILGRFAQLISNTTTIPTIH